MKKNVFELIFDGRESSDYSSTQSTSFTLKDRINRYLSLTNEQLFEASILQLQLRIKDYLSRKNFVSNEENFTHFLSIYVDLCASKRADFAKEINVSSVYLSQIINQFKEPNSEFLSKLGIHSETNFSSICGFQGSIWIELFYKDKLLKAVNQFEEKRETLLANFSNSHISKPNLLKKLKTELSKSGDVPI